MFCKENSKRSFCWNLKLKARVRYFKRAVLLKYFLTGFIRRQILSVVGCSIVKIKKRIILDLFSFFYFLHLSSNLIDSKFLIYFFDLWELQAKFK